MILETRTKSLIDNYRHNKYHAVLLSGPQGIGLQTVAIELARSIGVEADYIVKVIPEEGMRDISIDQIRYLYKITKSIRSDNIVIFIDDAEKMSHQAQNALLKLIEEPPMGAKFILASHQKQLLLPTILSRVVEMEIQPVSDTASQELINSLSSDKAKNEQVMFLAKGLPAKINRLLTDDKYFDSQAEMIRDARLLMTAPEYDKYKVTSRYIKDREKALALLGFVGQLFVYAASKSTTDHQKLLAVSEAIDNIVANGNLRIHLLSLIKQL